MWKIFFEYEDGGELTITGKEKDIPLRLALKYHNLYSKCTTTREEYQQYPKAKHDSMPLVDKIKQLEGKNGESANDLISRQTLLESLIHCNGLGRKSFEAVIEVIKQQPTVGSTDIKKTQPCPICGRQIKNI